MKRLAALLLCASLAACGGLSDGAEADSDGVDALSSTTYSMEMVRQNPALLPGVVLPEGLRVAGRGRKPDVSPNAPVFPLHGEDSFEYTVNQLGQFLQLADPAVFKGDGAATVYSRQPGDLYAADGKLPWDQVEQGALGDCYFAASLAAVLFTDKSNTLSTQLITPHTVSGKVVSYYGVFFQATGRKVKVEVDPDLLHSRAHGEIYYMASTDTKAGYEEWAPSLIEKAYAQWHGSYNAIGNGGTAADAIFALTGKKTKSFDAGKAATVPAIEAAGKTQRAQVACTYGDHDGVKYTGTGVYSDHCYTLRGVRHAGSKVFVQLRNPWGPTAAGASEPSEPEGDGVQDGIFELDVATFQKLYKDVDIVP